MKKFTKILGVAAVLLCGMMLTGCETADAIKEEFTGPKNKWLEKEVEYKKDESSASAKGTVYLYYTDDENPTVAGLNSDIDLVTGLNIIFIPEKPEGQTVSTLYTAFKNAANGGDIPYVVYNLPKGEEISENDGNSSTPFKFTMTDAKWTAFCVANPSVKNSAKSEIPYPFTSSYFKKVDMTNENVKALFSWKQLLIMLLQE